MFSTNDTGEIPEMLNLASNHIEADTRMYIHIKDCLSSDPNIDHVIISSPNTDVFVLGIRFWVEFEKNWVVKGYGKLVQETEEEG